MATQPPDSPDRIDPQAPPERPPLVPEPVSPDIPESEPSLPDFDIPVPSPDDWSDAGVFYCSLPTRGV